MLLGEFQDAMHRAGVDWPWATDSNMHSIAEQIYGGATDPTTGSDLVPGGLPGHDAVAKLIKKNLAMFKAIAQLRQNDLAEVKTRNLMLFEAKAQKALDDRRIAQVELALAKTQEDVAKREADMTTLKRQLFSVQNERGTYLRAMREFQEQLTVYRQLYGDAVMHVVKDAVTGKRLKDDLANRCENERLKIGDLQALVV